MTHAHPNGVAGAVAVAIAAALCASTQRHSPQQLLSAVLEWTPRGYTYDGIQEAWALAQGCGVIHAAKTLGNGSGVTAPDTVPLCLWLVPHHLESSYEDALWATVSALGDRDTTCAIGGGVLVLRRALGGFPARG